ncbi:MAG: DUF2141 domain-containing protein [Acidovorax sp.]
MTPCTTLAAASHACLPRPRGAGRFARLAKVGSLPLGLTLALALTAPLAAADDAAQVRLEVSTLRNTQGTLNCRLFSEGGGFPDGDGMRTTRVRLDGPKGVCLFTQLPAGTYAVAVVHDENSNGRLDKNLLGLPTEGYGVSNNRTHALTAPIWDEARFTVAPGQTLDLRVALRY